MLVSWCYSMPEKAKHRFHSTKGFNKTISVTPCESRSGSLWNGKIMVV